MRDATCLLVAAALIATPAAVKAQSTGAHSHPAATGVLPSDSINDFLERARTATRRYADPARAVRDGYRRVGPDFPAMGEHWFNIALAFGGPMDAARPPVLSYATIAGTPTLIGVGWAVPLLAGEAAPSFPTPDAWHAHDGSLDAEAFGEHVSGHPRRGARIAVLHGWIWLPNPDGVFATDNWALPFVRTGLTPPTSVPPTDAARMISLAVDTGGYWARWILERLGPTDGVGQDGARIAERLDAHRRDAADFVALRTGRALTDDELAWLSGRWSALWRELESVVSPERRARLSVARP